MIQPKATAQDAMRLFPVCRPAIACGHWWQDNWCSPYLRGRFTDLGAGSHLRLKINNPNIRDCDTFMRVRVGPRTIAEITDVSPGDWIDTRIPLAPYVTDRDELDISLRFDATWQPGNGDIRQLGALLFDWHIEHDPVVSAD